MEEEEIPFSYLVTCNDELNAMSHEDLFILSTVSTDAPYPSSITHVLYSK
jgi:hypothetical protein